MKYHVYISTPNPTTVTADRYEVNQHGDLTFYSNRPIGERAVGSLTPVGSFATQSFASGHWSRVVEIPEPPADLEPRTIVEGKTEGNSYG